MTAQGVELIPIGNLEPDPGNVRRHGPRAQRTLDASLRRFGAARSVVVDGDGVVVAGNDTLRAAREAGVEQALVVDSDGGRVVVVERRDWSEDEARAYGLVDNRAGDLSEWDLPAYAGEIRELSADQDLAPLGWTPDELAAYAGADRPFEPPPLDPGAQFEAPGRQTDVVVRLTEQQRDTIEEAIALCRKLTREPLSDGEALARICAAWTRATRS